MDKTNEQSKMNAVEMCSLQTPWVQMLTSAPHAVYHLVKIISSWTGEDFSLKDNTPTNGFQYLEYPGSFRTCLLQISNGGYRAFNEAQRHMLTIQIHCSEIEQQVTIAENLINGQRTANEADMLRKTLEKIKRLAGDCRVLAKKTEDAFSAVLKIISELNLACLARNSERGQTQSNLEKEWDQISRKKEDFLSSSKAMEERCAYLQKCVEDAQSDFKIEMEQIPKGWTALRWALTDKLMGSIGAILCIARNTLQCRTNMEISDVGTTDSKPNDKENSTEAVSRHRAYSSACFLFRMISGILDLAQIGSSSRCHTQENPDTLEKAQFFKRKLKKEEEEILHVTSNQEPRTMCLELCKNAIEVCEKIESSSIDKWTNIQSEIGSLKSKAEHFKTKVMEYTSVNQLEAFSSGKLLQTSTQSAHIKTELAKQVLIDAKDRYDKALKMAEKEQSRLRDITSEMENISKQQGDIEVAQQHLLKGFNVLLDVQMQWENLLHFFEMMNIDVGYSLHGDSFLDFEEYPEVMMSERFGDLMTKIARQAKCKALVVKKISGAYVSVSTKCINDKLSNPIHVLSSSLSHSGNSAEAQRLNAELKEGMHNAATEIETFILKEREDIYNEIDEICKQDFK